MDDRSNRFIVTIMDVYSRYLIAIPVRNHKASTVSRCLYESVVALLWDTSINPVRSRHRIHECDLGISDTDVRSKN